MIKTKEQIIEYFQSGLKVTKDFKIGIEHEKFLFNTEDNKRIVGITGESKKIKALAKSWGIHSKKVSSQGENYLIDHTGLVILLDQNGNFSSTIDYKDDFESSLKAIKSIL